MRLSFALAEGADAAELAELRVATARDLTARFGGGHWSGETSERGVLADMQHAAVWVARRGRVMVGTFRLATKKPWAIDRAYFTASRRPLYLTDMAVRPDLQGRGIGRACLAKAVKVAHDWPADQICLDAYDADAGAGGFYAKCGFTERGRVDYRGVPLIYFEMVIER
jgi:GNAT superfamily N-acetyltransferase